MKIDRDEARRVAGLAHLEFDDAGLDRMASEMTKILTYIDQLREVDVEGFEERDAAVTPMREDEPRPSVDRELRGAQRARVARRVVRRAEGDRR